MKKTIYFGIAAMLASAALLSSCQADMDTPDLQVPETDLKANITLLDLKNAYQGQYNQLIYLPGTWVKDENDNIVGGDPVYVHGRVVSSDASGNIYKSLVIQDETAALSFSIARSSMFNDYRLGQEIVVDLTGMYIGYYRELQQIGYPTTPYDNTPQLGFMAYDYWLQRAHLNGLPNPDFKTVTLGSDYPTDEYYMIRMNNFSEINTKTLPEMQSQLVEFSNVHFKITEGEETFAPYQESVNRTLVDANGQEMTVRNSGYSNFYNELIPEGTGMVRGILSYYGDSWQIVLRSLDDVIITDKGNQEDPFTVEDIVSQKYMGMDGWSKGYIVGSVKAGVTTVESADDVIFGAAAEMDNNLLIADSADESDISKCAVVSLPQATLLRALVNLIDHPDMYKKELMVNGMLDYDMGLPGVVGSKGGINDFYIDGKHLEEPGTALTPSGNGTAEKPYNVAYVIKSTADASDVWVEGYVEGYVVAGNFAASSIEFSATDVNGSNNYLNQSNVVLSEYEAPYCSAKNSVPAQLNSTSRPVLGLKDNPGMIGRKVRVKCSIKTYLGVRGVRDITEVVPL